MEDSGIEASKLAVFSETTDELLENKHKALVFSQSVDHLTILRETLDAKGVSYQYLDGSTTARQRKQRPGGTRRSRTKRRIAPTARGSNIR